MTAPNSPPESIAPKGIEHAGVIDYLGFHSETNEVLMVLVEKRPWIEQSPQLFQLQEKLNAYLSFILDGEMLETYPQFSGKQVRVRLECASPPGPQETAFLQHVYEQTALQGIAFEVEVVGGTCGCGKPAGDCGTLNSPAE